MKHRRAAAGAAARRTAKRDAALRESEARHRLQIESWAQAIWETDGAGVVVADSPSWRAYTGQTLDEWLGYGWVDAIHPDDRAYAERQWREAMAARRTVDAEFRLRSPDGGWRWTNVRAAPVLDAGGKIEKWAGVNIDIDARKRAEEALRESEERYRTLFESMDEAYAVVDVLKDDGGRWTDFRFLEVNPAFLKHTTMPWPVGKTATELLGTPNPRWTQLYGHALDTNRPLRVEESEATLGIVFDLNIFALDRERNRVAVLFTNITDRKRAEAALRESESRLQLLVAELQHRTRNLLSVVSGVADETRAASATLEAFGERFDERLAALGRVQGLLSTGSLPGISLDELLRLELGAHGIDADADPSVRLRGPSVALQADTVQLLALALHELTTNALKHGALKNDGLLEIDWLLRDQEGDGPRLHLRWREHGWAIAPGEPRRRGFGRELIEVSLPHELDARTRLEIGSDGVTCSIEMPLPVPPA